MPQGPQGGGRLALSPHSLRFPMCIFMDSLDSLKVQQNTYLDRLEIWDGLMTCFRCIQCLHPIFTRDRHQYIPMTLLWSKLSISISNLVIQFNQLHTLLFLGYYLSILLLYLTLQYIKCIYCTCTQSIESLFCYC